MEVARNGVAEIALKGKIRTILLPTKLCHKLLKYAKRGTSARGRYSSRETETDCQEIFVWPEMKKLCESAGWRGARYSLRNLRGLLARTFYAACRDVVRLADVLGHSSIETPRLYLLLYFTLSGR